MPNLMLTQTVNGYLAVYEWRTFRFLLSDGRTVDVAAVWDDSNLREAVRTIMKAERIEGVAIVDTKSPDDSKPVKRVSKR